MPHNYISLRQLIADWAAQSGELPAIILHALCEREHYGQFPEGTFVLPHTGNLGPYDSLSNLVQACTDSFGPNTTEARADLAAVVARRDGILEFCALLGVKPPPSLEERPRTLLTGLLTRRDRANVKFLAPPRYPETDAEIAARNKEIEFENIKENIESQIESCISESEKYLKEIGNNRSNDIDVFLHKLFELTEKAENKLGKISSSNSHFILKKRLQYLKIDINDISSEIDRNPPTAKGRKQAKDYLKNQVSANNRLSKDEHFKAAKAATNGALSRRGFDRLWDESVPASWKRAGRPSKKP